MVSLSEISLHSSIPGLELSIDTQDGQRMVTHLAAAGVAVAAVLAVIGGFPLDMPMPTHSFGWVDPTCGLTRGSTAIVRGDFALAWRYNPASFLVMGFGAYGITRFACGALTGRFPTIHPRVGRMGWYVLGVAIVALALYQQSNAEFIMNSRL